MTGLSKASLGGGMCIVQIKSYFHWLEGGMVYAFRLTKQDCWLPSIPSFILPGLDIQSGLLFSSFISLYHWIQQSFFRYTAFVEHLGWSGSVCRNKASENNQTEYFIMRPIRLWDLRELLSQLYGDDNTLS